MSKISGSKKRSKETAGIDETPGKLRHKKKRYNSKNEDVSDNERDLHLQMTDIDSDKPKASNILELLTKGLRTSDDFLLNSVIRSRDDHVIGDIVRQLPAQLVPSLVDWITAKITTSSQTDLVLAQWLRISIVKHSSYLTSFPKVIESVRPVIEMTDRQGQQNSMFNNLQGKLHLLLSHVALQHTNRSEALKTVTDDEDSSDSDEDSIGVFEHSEEEVVADWTDDDHSSDSDDSSKGSSSEDER